MFGQSSSAILNVMCTEGYAFPG